MAFGLDHGFGVLPHLFGGFEIEVVRVVALVFAVVGRVLAADLRAGLVYAAHVVRLQMFANRVDQEVPIVVVLEDTRPIVKQIPADVFEVFELLGSIDRQGEIAAALGGAVLAEDFPLGEFIAFDRRDTKAGGPGGGSSMIVREIRPVP